MSYKTVRLGDVCQITDGTHYTPKDIQEGFPFLTVKDMNGNGLDFVNCSFISHSDYEVALKGNSSPQIGDVLFSKDGTVGKVHVVKESKQFAVLSSIAILKTNGDVISSDYLGHVLKFPTILAQAIKSKTGSAIRRIILSDLKKVTIPLPPLPEQKRIADVLDKADALREKRRLALQKLDTLLQSVFLEIFGNGSNFPKTNLSRVCNFITKGTTPKSEEIVEKPSGNSIPFLKVYHIIKDGSIDFDYKPSFVSIECHNGFLKRSKVYPDDVLMNIVGPPLGKIGIVSNQYSEWNINQAIAIFRAIPNNLIPRYLLHILKSPPILQGILSQAVGIRQQNLSLEQCRNIIIPLPPIGLQIKFSEIVKKIEALKSEKAKSAIKTENLFQSLQQRAFKGELFSSEFSSVES